MHNFIQELGLYLWAVIAHWQSYVTGGIVTALVNVYERRTNTVLPWKYYVWLFFVIAGLVAFFYAWHDEHHNAEVVIAEKAKAVGDLRVCLGSLKAENAKSSFYEQQSQNQQSTLSNQQSTINSCMLTLGKLAVPERARIITRGFVFRGIKNNSDPNDIGFVSQKCD